MRFRKYEFKSFFLVLLLACGLRFAGITFDSLWLDEGYQSMVDAHGQTLPNFLDPHQPPYVFRFGSPGSLPAVLSMFRQVDPLCPPLYFLALNRWMLLWGQSDLAVRSLSAVFSLVSLSALYLFARAVWGPQAALLSAIIQAVSPFDIHYAQEARMYALEMLASMLSCGSFFWLLTRRSQALVAGVVYSISSWALINSHYTGLFVLLFQGFYGLGACLKRRDRQLFLRLVACWIATLLLWCPWLDMFWQAASTHTAAFYVARTPSFIWPFTALFLRVPVNWLSFLCGNHVAPYAIPIYLTASLLLLFGGLAAFGEGVKWSKFQHELDFAGQMVSDRRRLLRYLWAWALLPAVLLWAIDVVENHRVVEIARYTAGTAPAVYLLAGVGAASLLTTGLAGRVIVMLQLVLALVNNTAAHVTPQREPWRQMAASVDSLCAADDLLLVAQYYDIVCLDRYLHKPLRQVGISPNYSAVEMEKLLGNRQRFWLLTAQEGESAIAIIPTRFQIVKQVDFPHGLHLRLYQVVGRIKTSEIIKNRAWPLP